MESETSIGNIATLIAFGIVAIAVFYVVFKS